MGKILGVEKKLRGNDGIELKYSGLFNGIHEFACFIDGIGIVDMGVNDIDCNGIKSNVKGV